MSALTFGASDFTTTGPWDAGAVAWQYGISSTGTVFGPAIPCSAWQGVYCFFRVPSLHQISPNFQWYQDQALTKPQGGRTFMYDGNVVNAFEVNLRHLGPWLQVSLIPVTPATVWTPFITLMNSNRSVGYPTMPDAEWSRNSLGSIAPSGSITTIMPQNPTGRFAASVQAGTQNVTVSWQMLHFNYAYGEFANYTVAANTRDYRELIGPNSSVQVVVTNQSATTACTGAEVLFILSGPPG